MATLHRYKVEWDGLADLPGVSIFYCDSTSTLSSGLSTFFTAIRGAFPSGLSWNFTGAGDALDDASGHITGTFSDTAFSVSGNSGTSTFASGVGTYVQWNTADVGAHRRIRGRTFLTAMTTNQYSSTGQVTSGEVAILQAAANALVAGENLKIWTRPPKGADTGGSSHLVTSALVSSQISQLRTRRR